MTMALSSTLCSPVLSCRLPAKPMALISALSFSFPSFRSPANYPSLRKSISIRSSSVAVSDPNSLLLYGMQLDFSDALIGGGFSFKNPNATQTCGRGKSFAAEM